MNPDSRNRKGGDRLVGDSGGHGGGSWRQGQTLKLSFRNDVAGPAQRRTFPAC